MRAAPNTPPSNPLHAIDRAIYDCRILIIDDDLSSQILLEEILLSQGFKNLYFADDGQQGLDKMVEVSPDLVLLDLLMPNMNGHDFCQHVRAMADYQDLPILVQTWQDGSDNRIEAFASGATDFVTKPLLGEEILARIRMHLSNRILIRQLSEFSSRVRSELDSARRMQTELMPDPLDTAVLAKRYGIDIAHYYQASSELGGDYLGFIPLDNYRLAFYMGDFNGHGITAAINTFRMDILIHQAKADARKPQDFLRALNDQLQPLLAVGQFSTLIYGIFDCHEWTLRYVSAAAPKPLLHTRKETIILGSEGTPIGLSKALFEAEAFEVKLPVRGTLIFHSDALIEEKGRDGSFFGRERLLSVLASDQEIPDAKGRVDQLVHSLQEHVGGELFRDDLTLLVMGFEWVERNALWDI